MKKSLLLVAFAVLLVGIVVNVTEELKLRNNKALSRKVLSDEVVSGVVTPTIEVLNPTPSTPPLSSTPMPTANSGVGLGKDNSVLVISNLIYPGSQVENESATNLSLKSVDSADSITSWYADKIRSLGFNVTSFVTTKTNGNVLNKLVGAGGGSEISIEIQKNAAASSVSVKVTLGTQQS